jgi:branched-chain amino acid transport system substrate-binding protein
MLKLKQFNPDALIFHWAGTPTFAFVDQLYDSGMGKRVVVYGIGDYSAPDFPARTAPKTNLHLVHAITNKAAITPLTVPFFEAYEKATGKAPPYYAVQQYDSMLLMFEGLRRVKELTGDVAKDRQAIRDALDTITQSKPVTATRGTLHFEPLEKGHRVLAPAAVVQIQSGERVLVWPAGPAAGKFIDPRK